MRIRLDDTKSIPRQIWGGSPQGCVTANTMFRATIEHLHDREYEGTNIAGVLDLAAHRVGYKPWPKEVTPNADNTLLEDLSPLAYNESVE